MSATIPYESELFRGGPPFWLQKWLHLIRPNDPKIGKRVTVVVLLGWVPLLVLAVVQGLAWRGGTEGSFLVDFAVHARSLVAAPLFIIAESFCIPRLGAIARHFLEAELVAGSDRARFDDAVTSSRRLLAVGRADGCYRRLRVGCRFDAFLPARGISCLAAAGKRPYPFSCRLVARRRESAVVARPVFWLALAYSRLGPVPVADVAS